MSSQLYHRVVRSGLAALKASTGQKSSQVLARPNGVPNLARVAHISTSKKDRETITADVTTTATQAKAEEEAKGKKRHWQYLGYETHDQDADQNAANGVFFFSVTFGIVGIGFVLAYWPDHQLRNWAQREAHIQLARREALGLPLVDPNLVPPESVNLPTEEELGDFEIII